MTAKTVICQPFCHNLEMWKLLGMLDIVMLFSFVKSYGQQNPYSQVTVRNALRQSKFRRCWSTTSKTIKADILQKKKNKKKTGNPFLYQLDMTCNSIPTTWQNFERRVWLAGLVVLKAGFWIAPFILVQFLTHNLGIHSGRYLQNESADHLEFWILINLLLNETVLVYSK